MENYFKKWYLKMNKQKTVTTVFHLDNHQANRTLNVVVDGKTLPKDTYPKYFGVTLDRSLTYCKHLENISQKAKKRNAILNKIAGSSWGVNQSVLRTKALALI
jgi:hypothetical protein